MEEIKTAIKNERKQDRYSKKANERRIEKRKKWILNRSRVSCVLWPLLWAASLTQLNGRLSSLAR